MTLSPFDRLRVTVVSQRSLGKSEGLSYNSLFVKLLGELAPHLAIAGNTIRVLKFNFAKESIVKTGKVISAVLLVLFLATPSFAVKSGDLVVGGKNFKVGMPLNDAIKLLGYPDFIRVNRGTDSLLDSVALRYPKHGVIIRALSGRKVVEAIEIEATFKGKFASGIKLGDKFSTLIAKYGPPNSLTSQMARYPTKGLYFLLNQDVVLSAKVFAKDTKLLEHRLMNP